LETIGDDFFLFFTLFQERRAKSHTWLLPTRLRQEQKLQAAQGACSLRSARMKENNLYGLELPFEYVRRLRLPQQLLQHHPSQKGRKDCPYNTDAHDQRREPRWLGVDIDILLVISRRALMIQIKDICFRDNSSLEYEA